MSGCEKLSSVKQHEKRTETTRHETVRPVALHSIRYENQRHCYVQHNNKANSCNHCCSGKAISITYSEFGFECQCVCVCVCVCVALVVQHAKRMRHIVLSSVASLAPPYFSTLSHKRQDLRKKVIEHKIRVLIFTTNFV
jgi:hypothetical protein